MPVSRKSNASLSSGSIPVPAPQRLPARIVLFALVRDESGSMSRWRGPMGQFLPAVLQHLITVGGPKVADLIYLHSVVVSGDVVTTEFTPLNAATDPTYTPDGDTPLGEALATTADKITSFLETVVFPQESTVKALEVLIASDLVPSGETDTESGVVKFLEMVKKYRAHVTILAPDPKATNHELAKRLDVNERGIKYLDSDPKSLLNLTFDSLLSASRKLTGSNPTVRTKK